MRDQSPGFVDGLRVAVRHCASPKLARVSRPRHTGEGRCPLQRWVPSFVGTTRCWGLVAQFGDDPERLPAAGDPLEIVEGVAPPFPEIVPGRPGAVRAEDCTLHPGQFVAWLGRL